MKIRIFYKKDYGERMVYLTPNEFGHKLPSNVETCAEMMLFTGIKDKTGKEIYEGDIIKHRQFEQHEKEALKAKEGTEFECFGVTKFHNGAFYISVSNSRFSILYLHEINGNNQILKCWHGHNGLPNIYEGADGFEIIGNIYETPELLTIP